MPSNNIAQSISPQFIILNVLIILGMNVSSFLKTESGNSPLVLHCMSTPFFSASILFLLLPFLLVYVTRILPMHSIYCDQIFKNK